MGIHDRDYYRESTRRYFDPWGREATTVWLIIVTVVAFVLDMVSRDAAGNAFRDLFIYDFAAVRRGEVWRLITPVFLHAGVWHLFFNMLVLYWAGSAVEELYGSREFLCFYLAAGVFSGAADFLAHSTGLLTPARGLGASGAVTAVFVVLACHYPHRKVLLYFLIPMPVWLLVVLYVAVDFVGFLGNNQDGVGHLVHLAGALFGFVYYKSGLRFLALFPAQRATAARAGTPRLRVVPADPEPAYQPREPAAAESQARPAGPPDEHFEARVDRVLEKVAQHGQESLTAEERELLFQASERYKKRRK